MGIHGNKSKKRIVCRTTVSRSRKGIRNYNPELAGKCLKIAEELYRKNISAKPLEKINTVAELYLSTSKEEYAKILLDNRDLISNNIISCAEVAGRVVEKLHDTAFTAKIEEGVSQAFHRIAEQQKQNPYGVPYKPYIWGAGWDIQSLAVKELLLHIGFPKIFSSEYAFNAMNFILGCHPGENTASFVSGVGVNSLTVAVRSQPC